MRTPDSNFYHEELVLGEFALGEEQSRHAVKVFRAREGDLLTLADGKGHFAEAEVVKADPKACMVKVERIENAGRARPKLKLALACLKDDANEEVALHSSEAELAEIILLRTERSLEPRNSDLERTLRRMRAKCLVSLEQARKAWMTQVLGPVWLDEFLESATGTLVLCDMDGSPEVPSEVLEGEVTILVGPEGGFSAAEIGKILHAKTAETHLLGLGKTRLRARTAALFALGKLLR